MDQIQTTLKTISDFSGIGLAVLALIALIVYAKRDSSGVFGGKTEEDDDRIKKIFNDVSLIKSNHLSHIEAKLDRLILLGEKQTYILEDVKNRIDKINGSRS